METFSALVALRVGNSPVTGKFPSQRPVTRSFDAVFDLCWNQGWGQVLFEVLYKYKYKLVLFHICKYKFKYSEYLEDIKHIKYFFNQVQVKYKYFGNKQ